MAKRRRKLHRALEGLGAGLADAGSLMLRHRLMQDQNAMIGDRQADASERSQMFEVFKKVMSGELDPSVASQFLPDGIDASKFQPSADRFTAPIAEDIDKATSLSALPTAAGIHNKVRRRKDISTPGTGLTEQYDQPQPFGPLAEDELSTLDAYSIGPTENPQVQHLLDQRAAKADALQREVPYTKVSGIDPDTQVMTDEYVQSNQLGTTGPRAQERTTDAEGARAGGIAATTERLLRPEAVATSNARKQGEVDIEYSPATTRAKAGQAGQVSFAQTANAQAAQHTPEAITGAARRAGEIAKATAEAEIQANMRGGKLTLGQATAAGNYVRIAQEHATMKQLEDAGVRFSNLTHSMRQFPLVGGSIANLMGHGLTKHEQEYLRAADQFKALEGKIMSGVTVRPDEAINFIQDLTAQSSDNADVITGKQAARAAILQSAQIQAGPGGNYQAGLALGKAVLNGQIPVQTLMRLQFSDADMLRGLKDGYGKVVFAGAPSVVGAVEQ